MDNTPVSHLSNNELHLFQLCSWWPEETYLARVRASGEQPLYTIRLCSEFSNQGCVAGLKGLQLKPKAMIWTTSSLFLSGVFSLASLILLHLCNTHKWWGFVDVVLEIRPANNYNWTIFSQCHSTYIIRGKSWANQHDTWAGNTDLFKHIFVLLLRKSHVLLWVLL